MNEKAKYFLHMCWFFYLISAGVYIFGRGFLLTRNAREEVSTCEIYTDLNCDDNFNCNDSHTLRKLTSTENFNQVCLPVTSRVILMVVDALRYDFAVYNDSLKSPDYYQNKLPVIRELLMNESNKSKLYKFVADPPTTTLQRCKALTTGSLPTFIDAGSNFASSEINEDNLIDQLIKNGGKAVLLGDDTWEGMHPELWLRKKAYHSFHTWDLDTVDKAVDSDIFGELERTDWNLLVVHYLGVDHAGHRYGPKHPEMSRKLNELNTRLQRIVKEMPHEAILYVIGDHGMTATGDHGGESENEVSAALFVYAPAGLTSVYGHMSYSGDLTGVPQVDLTPTLAAALSLPIPFSNLGTIISKALPKSIIPNWEDGLLRLWSNIVQVMGYIRTYSKDSNEFSKGKLKDIEISFDKLRVLMQNATEDQYETVDMEARKWLLEVREMCRRIWVRFDFKSMIRGILLVFIAIFFHYLALEGLPPETFQAAINSGLLVQSTVLATLAFVIFYSSWLLGFVDDLALVLIFTTSLFSSLSLGVLLYKNSVTISQKWHKSRLRPFHDRFARLCLVASAVALFSNSFIIEEASSSAFLFYGALAVGTWAARMPRNGILYLCCIGVLLKLSRNYWTCREEHGECFLNVSNTETSESLIFALLSIASITALSRVWLRHMDDMQANLAALIRHFAPTIVAVMICGHWSTQWGPYKIVKKSRQLGTFAWITLLVSVFILWVLPPAKRRNQSICLRASFVYLSLLISLAYALTVGLKWAPGVAIAFFTGYLTLELVHMIRKASVRCSEFSFAALWCILAVHHFFGTGHHATFAHIRWSAAFASIDKDFTGHIIPGAMVLLNTFGSHFAYGVAAPLLVLWKSDLEGREALVGTYTSCLNYVLCFAIRVAVCILAATVHCRHLMVWKIFAPKLIFECGGMLAAMLGSIVAYLLAWRITGQIDR